MIKFNLLKRKSLDVYRCTKALYSQAKRVPLLKIKKVKEGENLNLSNLNNTQILQKNENLQKNKNLPKIENSHTNKDTDTLQDLTEYDLSFTNSLFQQIYHNFLDKAHTSLMVCNDPELSRIYEDLNSDWSQSRKRNMYNYWGFFKLLEVKGSNPGPLIEWLDHSHNLLEPKYTIKILKYIVDSSDLDELSLLDLSILSRLILKEYNQKKYKLMKHLEKTLQKMHMDITPTESVNLFCLLIESGWKNNDKNFCDFASRFTINNLCVFNYNQFSLFLERFAELNRPSLYAWRYIMEEVINKFKTLYKSKTIERLASSFVKADAKFPGEMSNAVNLILGFLKDVPMQKLQMGEFAAWMSLFNSKYIDEATRNSMISTFTQFALHKEILNAYSDTVIYMEFYMLYHSFYKKANPNLLYKINPKIQREIIKNKFTLNYLLAQMIKLNYIQFFPFETLSDETFANLGTLQGFYYQSLLIAHYVSKSDKRICPMFDNFVRFKQDSSEEGFIGAIQYLKNYKEEQEMQLYKKVKLYFVEFLLDDKDNLFNLKVLGYPLYKDLVDQAVKENFIKLHKENLENRILALKKSSVKAEDVDENYFVLLMLLRYSLLGERFKLPKINNFSGSSLDLDDSLDDDFDNKIIMPRLDLDSDKFETMRKIRDFANISLEDFHSLYKNENQSFEFFESSYEKIIYK